MQREEIKIGAIVDRLDSIIEARERPATVIKPLIFALKKVYADTNSDKTKNVLEENFSETDFEDRLKRFEEVSIGVFENPMTVPAYKARARRAIRLYEEKEQEAILVKRRAEQRFDTYELIINSMKNVMLNQLRSNIVHGGSLVDDVEIFPFPMSKGKIGTVMLPKKASSEDLRRCTEFLRLYLRIKEREEDKM